MNWAHAGTNMAWTFKRVCNHFTVTTPTDLRGGPQLHWSEAAAALADQQQAPAPDAGAPSETLAALDPRIALYQV